MFKKSSNLWVGILLFLMNLKADSQSGETKKYVFVKHVISLHSLLRKVILPWYHLFLDIVEDHGPPHSELHYNMHDVLQNDAYTAHLATYHEECLRHVFLTSLEFLYSHVRCNIFTTMILFQQSCFLRALKQATLDIICSALSHKYSLIYSWFISQLFKKCDMTSNGTVG